MKYRIVNRKRFVVFAVSLILLITFMAAPAVSKITASEKISKTYIAVTVQEGDTLWALAKTYGPQHSDVRKVIYDICQINNLESCTIYEGQTITVPVSAN